MLTPGCYINFEGQDNNNKNHHHPHREQNRIYSGNSVCDQGKYYFIKLLLQRRCVFMCLCIMLWVKFLFCIPFQNIRKPFIPGDVRKDLRDLSDMVMSLFKIPQLLPFFFRMKPRFPSRAEKALHNSCLWEQGLRGYSELWAPCFDSSTSCLHAFADIFPWASNAFVATKHYLCQKPFHTQLFFMELHTPSLGSLLFLLT